MKKDHAGRSVLSVLFFVLCAVILAGASLFAAPGGGAKKKKEKRSGAGCSSGGGGKKKSGSTVVTREIVNEYVEKITAESATGCRGAGAYRDAARALGYPHLAVVEWSSSAGDWTFIVSKDGFTWVLFSQENNYPRSGGFSYYVDTSGREYYGTSEEVLAELAEEAHYGG